MEPQGFRFPTSYELTRFAVSSAEGTVRLDPKTPIPVREGDRLFMGTKDGGWVVTRKRRWRLKRRWQLRAQEAKAARV
jgi:hypothetical protein